ncbi:hypothetical protein NG796_19405 [Laspinema sp. A4]|nr:hypothetical protein [Laspinema sp. D2d]
MDNSRFKAVLLYLTQNCQSKSILSRFVNIQRDMPKRFGDVFRKFPNRGDRQTP